MFHNQTKDDIVIDEEFNTHFSLQILHHYYTMIIEPIGILGNIISLFIFIRIYINNKSNTCILYTILCGLNIIYISYKSLDFKLDLSVQAKIFTKYSLLYLLAWMQVLISFHRFIYVIFQAKAKILTKKVFYLYISLLF